MELIVWPAWTEQEQIWYGALAATWISVWVLELSGLSQIRYSKFRRAKGIATRTGMLILYGLPLAVAVFDFARRPTSNIAEIAVTTMLGLHFAKRCLESAFLHRYSGPIDIVSVSQIAFFYSLVVWIDQFTTRSTPQGVDVVFVAGVALFVIGEVGNFVHHKILAGLRRGGDMTYVLPTGGLFGVVACPHYLFELIAWLGINLVSRQVGAYMCLVGLIGYLCIRARKTLVWYRGQFPTLPSGWTAIVPRVF